MLDVVEGICPATRVIDDDTYTPTSAFDCYTIGHTMFSRVRDVMWSVLYHMHQEYEQIVWTVRTTPPLDYSLGEASVPIGGVTRSSCALMS